MKWDSVQFTSAIDQVRMEKVRPAISRAIFPVNNEEEAVASVSFVTGKGEKLSGKLNPVGVGDDWDGLVYGETTKSQRVLGRRIRVGMNQFQRMAAEQGRISDFTNRARKVFDLYEIEIDNLCFNGGNGVPGLRDSSYYTSSTNTGTAIAAGKTLDNMTVQEAIYQFDEAVTKSKLDGVFRGDKAVIASSTVFQKLRNKTFDSGLTAMQKIIEITPSIRIFESPDVGDDVLILDTAEVELRFPFYMRQVGDVKEEGGDMTAYFAGYSAGVIVSDPRHLVKVTGLL